MGFWGSAANLLTGGVGTKVLEIADDAIDTQSERRADDADDLRDVRGMQIQGGLSQLVMLYKYNTSPLVGLIILFLIFIHVFVDAISRLIRPWVTIQILGGFFGYWVLPKIVDIDAAWMTFAVIVLTFWFGGRFVMKDILPVIKIWKKMAKAK